jgi:hypothetical protein
MPDSSDSFWGMDTADEAKTSVVRFTSHEI